MHATINTSKLCLSSVQSLSCVRLFVIPWTAAHNASLSISDSQSLLKLMSIESVMPYNHLILSLPPSVVFNLHGTQPFLLNVQSLTCLWMSIPLSHTQENLLGMQVTVMMLES